MISTSTGFKTAIRSSSRRIKARLIFPDKTIEDVDLIEIDSYLTDEEDFLIGTANMDAAKIEISDDPLNPIFYDFNGKEADIQLGITLSDSSLEYHSIGKYTAEKSDRKNSKIYLELVDRMYKADMDYTSNLSYPATLSQILASAASQAGIVLDSTTFLNSDHIVNEEPVYEGITCRQVFAYIAELAGGYARINRLGQLTILSLGSLSAVNITGDYYIDWKKSEAALGIIDKLIIKNGEESASSGTGTNIYTIVDNIFVSNPGSIVDNVFSSISTVNYKAGELNWIGDFSLDVGDKVTVDGEETYILNRKLKYTGGLRETVKIPGKSNIEKNSTGKPNTNLEIRDIKTKIKIISGEIQQVIDNGVTRTEWQQTVDGFNQTVSEIELTPGPEGQSAYEAAVANGFTGTIQEWLASLEGPQGPQGLQGLQGDKGDQGIEGPRGPNGLPSYTHIAYANSADGTVDFSTGDSSRDYIGMYTDSVATDSTNPAMYNWTLVKGANGDQGVPGPTGPDGKTSYLHIAYATNSTGTAGFSTTVSAGKTYIGQYTDFTAADSTDPSKYSWTLIKGDKGDTGAQGPQGVQGPSGPTLYTWIKYADTPTTGMSDTPTGKTYIGLAYNKTTSTESSNYSDYSWSLIKGDQGPEGPQGPQGQTLYTWIKYSAAADGTNLTDDPTGAKYIGIAYNKTSPTESTNKADYTWSLIEGPQGDQGPQGIQGPTGPTLYTWVKYADTPTSGMSNYPDGKTYMGIAYNKTTATESSTYADYTWSLIKGAQGDQGIQGPTGPQGNPTYTWIKYADTVTGSGMSDSPTGKRFLGLAHNKTTATESTNPGDYNWSPLYDNVQVGGRNLLVNYLLSTGHYADEQGSTIRSYKYLGEPNTNYFLSTDIPKANVSTYDLWFGTYPFTASSASNGVAVGEPRMINSGANGEIEITFRSEALINKVVSEEYHIKLEKGNIATDWTPAPEDIDSKFSEHWTQIDQNKKDITLRAIATEVEGKIWKQASAPAHEVGRLWLETDKTPNVLYRSTGSAWVKVTPTNAAEVGAYSSADGGSLAIRVTSAEQKITPEAIVNTFTTQFETDENATIEKGIVTLSKDGVNVGTSESEINSQLAHDGLSVRDGGAAIANFGVSGAVIPHIESDVLNFSDKTGQYYAGATNTYKSVSECLEDLFPRNNRIHLGQSESASGADIMIFIASEINETINLIGLQGRGRLIIRVNKVTFNGNFRIYGNTIPIYIIGGGTGSTIKNPNTVSGYMFDISGTPYVQVSGLNLDNNGGYYLSAVKHGSNVHFQSIDAVRCNYLVDADNACSATVVESKGNMMSGVMRLQEGARGYFSGSAPAGGSLDYSTNKFVFTDGTVSRVNSSYSPPPVTSKTFTQLFTSATFDTLVHGTTTVDSYYGSTATQNRWDSSMGWKDGRIRMSNAVYNFFNGGSNISIRFRLRRKNSTHGSSLAVKPAPYNHSASFSTGATRGGWTSWATVPSSLFTSAGATLTFYNGVQGSAGYAIWDAIEVEVTVTKQV